MASKRRIRLRECSRKIRYDSQAAAQPAIQSLYWKRGDRVYAYKCRWCGGWHIAHKSPVYR